MFNAKLLYAEANFTLIELNYIHQRPGDNLDIYMKRFYDKALDSCNPTEERMLVDICLHGMLEESRIWRTYLSLCILN